ncbi:MAG: preprotein translocase subunit SecE [Clostridiales bacterium]|nr:preprotein translocase subunit SecE [Clostridiales bacterium]
MSTRANASEKARNTGKFFKGVKSELKKVHWPNRQELIKYTTVVIIGCALAIAFLWILDTTFGFGLNLILSR